MTSVRVAFFPGKVYDINLDVPASVGAVLDILEENDNVTVEDCMQLTVGGVAVNRNTIVSDGQKIVITKMVKGNAVDVTVAKFPGASQMVTLEDGATVQDAINAADFETDGFEVKLAGVTVSDFNTTVTSGSRIILVKKVKGN